jgi:hypothetical protein
MKEQKLYILARSHSDNKLLPFRSFIAYATKKEMERHMDPPWLTPITLEMVMDYLQVEENELYAYGAPWSDIFDAYGYGGYEDEFKEWFPDKGPWHLGKWKDQHYEIPSRWMAPVIDILKD